MRALLTIVLLSVIQTPSRNWRELLVVHGDDVRTEYLETLTRRRNVTWLAASKATREDLSHGNVVLAGTFETNPFLDELAPDAFAEWYEKEGGLVQVSARNPMNPDYRMVFVVGEIEKPVRRRRADVHVRLDGKTVLLGFESDDGSFEMRRFPPAEVPALEVDGFRFFTHGIDVPPAELRALVVTESAKADVHVYRSLEEKGLITDDTRTAHVEDGVFHVVLGVDERPIRFIAETLADDDLPLLVKRGRAAVQVYDGATLDRFDETARRLLLTSEPPSLIALADDERFEAASPFVTEAVSASFARFIAKNSGVLFLEAAERAWVRSLATTTVEDEPASPTPRSFQRGVTYAHMGYQIHNGYLSARGDDSLSKLDALGIDAVAVVPYTFMSDATSIAAFEVPRRAGSETDEDVVHAIRRAQSQGMTVMVKPQIWVRGGWPGDINPASEAERDRFFREYRRWILHYALMAEAYDAPLLAIGTELAKLTAGHRERWESIIDDIRCVYGGKLVYAANWGEEVQNVDFWDRLDYIGVDFYYPLSFDDKPDDDELVQGFEAALDQIRELHERYRKPVLLTEIGYASTKSPWKKPHASDKVRELSPEDQARAYAIAFAALEDETDWIHGMYWWKWPTNLDRGGLEHRGFTPNRKPAEEVLRRWYGSRLQ